MIKLVAGANMVIPSGQIDVQISTVPKSNVNRVVDVAVDASMYALSMQTQKVRGDADMIFYGQRQNASASLFLVQAEPHNSLFRLDLTRLDGDIGKIAVTATLDQPHLNFSCIECINIQLLQHGQTIAHAQIDGLDRVEAALILGEFYRHQQQWKFRLVDQGFAGGLKPLAEHFGVEIASDVVATNAAPLTATPQTASVPAAPPLSKPSDVPKVSLHKVSLNKTNQHISLEKKGNLFGEIRINLNWNRSKMAAASGGFFSKMLNQAKGIDLDLGCLYALNNGERGLVQALGERFGNYQHTPYIELSGDDRTGAVQDGEWMRINGNHWSKIQRLIVYAFIYEGAANWAATDTIVTIYVPDQPPIEIALTEGDSRKGLCAVVMLENRDNKIQVSREVRYFSSQQPLDQHYGWGLRWVAGHKN